MRLFLLLPTCVLALDNGLGKRPGLAWNSDYCTNCTGPPTDRRNLASTVSATGFGGEHFIHSIASYMHSVPQVGGANRTLQQLGFHYVNMDASWNNRGRSRDGKLVPRDGLWPSGLAATISYVHSLGLGFGLYGDRGNKDCAGNPGALGHESSDAQQFADWGVDWYKEDSCNAPGSRKVAFGQYLRMRDALNASGRPIWFALCGWNTWYGPPDPKNDYPGGKGTANSWRVGPDTVCGWACVMQNIYAGLSVSAYAGPTADGGGWNDGSLQLNPGMGCNRKENCMDDARHRSQFNAWSMLAMNLVLTGNFSALKPFVMETWSNPEILSINQDPLGKAAVQLHNELGAAGDDMFAECGGEPDLQKWVLGKDLSIKNKATNMCLTVKGCKTEVTLASCNDKAAHACGNNTEFATETVGKAFSLVSQLPGSNCVEVTKSHSLALKTCDASQAQQHFTRSAAGGLLASNGLCLTAPAPASKSNIIMGRPLSGDSDSGAAEAAASLPGGDVVRSTGFALMFLNNQEADTKMTCSGVCLQQLGLQSTLTYSVRDIWAHKNLADITPAAFSISVDVTAKGGSRVLRLTAKSSEIVV